MKNSTHTTVVVGGGVVGLSTAYWLSQHPRERVIVVEAQPFPASAASGHNTGAWVGGGLRQFGEDAAVPPSLEPFVRYCHGVAARVMETVHGLEDWCGWRAANVVAAGPGMDATSPVFGWTKPRAGWGWRREAESAGTL
jgi:hypothetical protein